MAHSSSTDEVPVIAFLSFLALKISIYLFLSPVWMLPSSAPAIASLRVWKGLWGAFINIFVGRYINPIPKPFLIPFQRVRELACYHPGLSIPPHFPPWLCAFDLPSLNILSAIHKATEGKLLELDFSFSSGFMGAELGSLRVMVEMHAPCTCHWYPGCFAY